MSMKLCKDSYKELIQGNIDWLLKQPRTLQRDHILGIVKASIDYEYPARSDKNDELYLRVLVGRLYAGGHLYSDDGELQDNREQPFIDFLRDNPFDIRDKMNQRMVNDAADPVKRCSGYDDECKDVKNHMNCWLGNDGTDKADGYCPHLFKPVSDYTNGG
jgi:hypothetical protein